jgi:phosphoenolpyruvate carboxylase
MPLLKMRQSYWNKRMSDINSRMTMTITDEISAIGGSQQLRKDIHFLGDLLGKIIRDQQGEPAFLAVESVRRSAKNRRAGDAHAAEALTQLISEQTLEQKKVLIKAFANYFQLINIAEDLQRIRVLREREGHGTNSETIDEAIQQLHAAGVSADEMRSLLDRLRVRLVFTAHPSEAKRQEVLIKLRDIAEFMATRERTSLLPREEQHLVDDIVRRVEQLWQTRTTRANKAQVQDEVDFGLYFIIATVIDVLVDFHLDLCTSLESAYPDEDWTQLPCVLAFASWIGGDRDGNPNVTPEMTLATLEKMHQAALQVYLEDIEYLKARFTQADDEVGVSAELRARVEAIPQTLRRRYPHEIYRQCLQSIADGLREETYEAAESLLDDLTMISNSLAANRGKHSTQGTLQRLILKVRLFGIHLLPLDVREDARLQTATLTEILKYYRMADDYASMPEPERQALLTQEIQSSRPIFPLVPHFSDETNVIINTWRMIAQAHAKYSSRSIDTYIGSMTQHPSDVLAMLLFASEVGVADDLDLVPLFETVDDLKNAPETMRVLFQNEAYKQHLQARGHRQQIMIGYSDSNKDGGYIASNWNLYVAQQVLVEICAKHGVILELFHGRGGSIGRGGGPTNRAILAQPPGSMQGPVKITEQGEVIAYRYSNRDIARRHFQQTMNAALLATHQSASAKRVPEHWFNTLETLSETSYEAYRRFVYETDGFLDYWQQATPINELANMRIGSRPAKRKSGGFDSIRAIPWVFSWMQSRAIIPSWYGVGHALKTFCEQRADGLEVLRQMYQDWLFFHNLIENVQLDVAKADMGIAALYNSLVNDETQREKIFSDLSAEHTRAYEFICKITGQTELLQSTPVLKISIERRNPYVDPLNFIQVDLLRQLRATAPDAPEYAEIMDGVLATINGIAAGMKTTG